MSNMSGSRPASGSLSSAFILAGVQIGGALLLALANQQGLIDDETRTRGVLVLIGLCLAAIGNRMPKTMDGPPPRSVSLAALRQSVLRLGGWALMLGGVVFAGLWACAPHDLALVGSLTAVGAAMLVTIGGCGWWVFNHYRSSAN
jgi:hypothetical protein